MKPSWDDAPDWASWLAQDLNSTWYWYQKRPYKGQDSWMDNYSGGSVTLAAKDEVNENWRDTLEQRPPSISIEPKHNALSRIREIAMTPDHFAVPYDSDQLKMANMVIQKMREKFELIASIAEDQL